ncbi:hypothetical protein ABIB40_003177 [Pedobacter sp. UYP30]|uniref:MCP four helix bundle domain-containing protein n=1 Tax=Pedobacter sp. UYP30 TaxID=1756400 RepID=UPI0033964669
MKIAFSLKNKLKMAFLLFCIASCSLLINFLGDRNVTEINKAFVSMHQDRLVPATDLFFIAEHLRQKSNLWQDAFSLGGTNVSPAEHLVAMRTQNGKIDSVLKKYEATKFVDKENLYLADFKKALTAQDKQETVLLSIYRRNTAEALKVYHIQNRALNAHTFSSLGKLIKIQLTVGDELMVDSQTWISGVKIYSTIQVLLAISIGLLVVGIIGEAKAVNIRNDKFNLN